MAFTEFLPVIGSGISFGQQLVNNNAQKQAQLRQNRMNIASADLEYKRNLEMWHMANEYNSPKAQMARYQDAGLNPNLIYGQGSSGNAGTVPRYQAPERTTSAFVPQLTGLISQYQDMRLKNAQIKGIEADAVTKSTSAEFSRLMIEAKLFDMRKRGEISEATLTRIQNELSSTWGDNNTVKWGEESRYNMFGIPSTFIQGYRNKEQYNDWQRRFREGTASKLEQSQVQVGLGNALKKIRDMEVSFLDNGGKYYNFILQFMKMMGGAL